MRYFLAPLIALSEWMAPGTREHRSADHSRSWPAFTSADGATS